MPRDQVEKQKGLQHLPLGSEVVVRLWVVMKLHHKRFQMPTHSNQIVAHHKLEFYTSGRMVSVLKMDRFVVLMILSMHKTFK